MGTPISEKTLRDVADKLLAGGKRFDAIDKVLEKVVDRMTALEDDGKETRALVKKRAPILPDTKAPAQSFVRAARAMKLGDWSQAPEEFKASQAEVERRKRIMNISTDTQGGYSVPESTEAGIIEMLKAASVVQSMPGIKSLTGLTTSPHKMVRQTGASTHNWVAEAATGTASTPTLGQITFTPHKSMIIVGFTNEQLALGEAGEAFARQDMTEQMALGEDLGFINGSGASSAPLGMLGMAGINTVAFGGGVTLDKLFEMLYEQEVDNVKGTSNGWLMHPLVRHDLRVLKDGEGRYLLDHTNQTLLGFPFKTSPQMTIPTGSATTGSLALIDFSEIVVAAWGALDFYLSKDAVVGTTNAFTDDLTYLRLVRHIDIQARHPEAIVTSTGITT